MEKPNETIQFTDQEASVVEEAFQQFMHTITVVARLRGIKGPIQLSEDRRGLKLIGAPATPAGKE